MAVTLSRLTGIPNYAMVIDQNGRLVNQSQQAQGSNFKKRVDRALAFEQVRIINSRLLRHEENRRRLAFEVLYEYAWAESLELSQAALSNTQIASNCI